MKIIKHIVFSILLSVFCLINSIAQSVPVSHNEVDIYNFLNEMATAKIIVYNDAIKPLSRTYLSELLLEIEAKSDQLTNRQNKELKWYLREFRTEYSDNTKQEKDIDIYRNKLHAFSLHPLGYYYADSVSNFSIQPIWGISYFFNDNGNIFHRWGGAKAYGSYNNFGFYASLRDNHESQRISSKQYLTPRTGGNYKGLDYSEMLGGITYAKDWLAIGLVKDFYSVGSNYFGSNIISNRAPSFAHLKLQLTPWPWFEFNYMHGWLISNVLDSTFSYITQDGLRRDVMHKKYISTNLFTFRPWQTLNLSFGNSIVYSDYNVNPAYMIPFMFYKSVDHSNNSTDQVGKNVGQNSSMFFNISFRGIKHLHIYYSQFIDELKIARWTKPDEHNFYSWKAGIQLSNWPINNVFFTTEYTKTVPITYQHDISTTTYTSNDYNLGHYMGDNSDVFGAEMRFHPAKNMNFTARYILERKGEEYGYIRSSSDLTKHPFMDEVKFKRSALKLGFDYEPTYGLHLFLAGEISNISGELESYQPPFFRGRLFTLNTGFNFNF